MSGVACPAIGCFEILVDDEPGRLVGVVVPDGNHAELVRNDDIPDRHTLNAISRGVFGRDRLDEALLVFGMNGNDDLIGRKRCKGVADGETDVRVAGNGIDRLPGKSLGRSFGDPFGVTERLLVAGEPVEQALPCNRHDNLNRVGLPELGAESIVGIFNGADHQDVSGHGDNVPSESPGASRTRA